jgi:ketosteroid isomerase-like protein
MNLAIPSLIAAAALALTACAKTPAAPPDEAALRALDGDYVEAWLVEDAAQQEKAVLALFSRDAVIMPGGGLPPESGIGNLKNFWFPENAAPTRVTHFTHQIDDVDLSGELGVVSGRYTLSFTYDDQSITQAGNYVIVAEGAAGKWRIKRMIWNDQPLTEV